ncbi:hypothetical protein [Planomonospora sp. ID82291]|uniref:hypothetical protein n=1 Tax=Planomonospora sp. ID82291 TaxID=2738136 RepID=UPI0018C44905|nr:hypothetical protein [Planomonospora sp. ID82291]MBG0818912.1 hypothetical protein [Planomonospora sp. ID82291]
MTPLASRPAYTTYTTTLILTDAPVITDYANRRFLAETLTIEWRRHSIAGWQGYITARGPRLRKKDGAVSSLIGERCQTPTTPEERWLPEEFRALADTVPVPSFPA